MAEARKPIAAKAAKDDESKEDKPDPELAKLRKELADLRAATDERVKRAVEAAKLEKRPYSVDEEVRRLWPEA